MNSHTNEIVLKRKQEIAMQRKMLEKRQQEISKEQSELSAQKAKRESNILAEPRSRLNKLNEEVLALGNIMKNADGEIIVLDKKIQELKKELKIKEDNLAALRQKNMGLSQSTNKLDIELGAPRIKIESLQLDRKSLVCDVSMIEDSIQYHQLEIAKLEGKRQLDSLAQKQQQMVGNLVSSSNNQSNIDQQINAYRQMEAQQYMSQQMEWANHQRNVAIQQQMAQNQQATFQQDLNQFSQQQTQMGREYLSTFFGINNSSSSSSGGGANQSSSASYDSHGVTCQCSSCMSKYHLGAKMSHVTSTTSSGSGHDANCNCGHGHGFGR